MDRAIKTILKDFFTHAFDGSGGDNFFEAGSCTCVCVYICVCVCMCGYWG